MQKCLLDTFVGYGLLECSHGTKWQCHFVIKRLFNGRLQVSLTPEDPLEEWEEILKHHDLFSLTGKNNRNQIITALEIHLVTIQSSEKSRNPECLLLGYAPKFTITQDGYCPQDSTVVKYELTNFRFIPQRAPVNFDICNTNVEIGNLLNDGYSDMRSHGYAYQHCIVSSYLEIRDLSGVGAAETSEQIHILLLLLSLSQRANILIAATHRFINGVLTYSEFCEPSFLNIGWNQPLIPDSALIEFLVAGYENMKVMCQKGAFGTIIDHYFQSLSLHSVWPMSLGIFTAVEGIKSSFFRNHQKASDRKYVVPRKEFNNNNALFQDIKSSLISYHPKFADYHEAGFLRSQISNLNMLPFTYQEQLKLMLDELSVSYEDIHLQAVVNIRNSIIHQATPVKFAALTDSDKEEEQSRHGWNTVLYAGNLLERIILAQLHYTGVRNELVVM